MEGAQLPTERGGGPAWLFSLSIVQLQLNVWYEFKPWTGGIAGRKAKVVFYSLLHDATPAPGPGLLQSLGTRISLGSSPCQCPRGSLSLFPFQPFPGIINPAQALSAFLPSGLPSAHRQDLKMLA